LPQAATAATAARVMAYGVERRARRIIRESLCPTVALRRRPLVRHGWRGVPFTSIERGGMSMSRHDMAIWDVKCVWRPEAMAELIGAPSESGELC
jgi:hypothetical protein